VESFVVAVTDYIEPDLEWERGELAKAGITLRAHQLRHAPEEQVAEACEDADIVVVNMARLSAGVVGRMKPGCLVIRHGIGYDNVDVDACTARGVQFANQPDYCVEEVAEHAVALLLACARGLWGAGEAVAASSSRGEWDFNAVFPVRRVAGRTLGVVGTGRIGKRVCELMGGFGMHILAHDPLLAPEYRVPEAEYVDMNRLVEESDFVTLHAPVTEGTTHLVNAELLVRMKDSAYLVNSSRAALVDTSALVEALEQGAIAGAAVDVYEVEPPPPDSPLLRAPHCLLTPHVAWASEDSAWQIRKDIVDDILRWKSGKDARHVVNGVLRSTAGGGGAGQLPASTSSRIGANR
jgi:D-3-phosphoglycerate dehydrogenase